MKNKYSRETEMASSCKQMIHCEDQHKRRYNRFTYKKHLRSRTELIALMSLALSFLHYQNKTFVGGMQIVSHESEIYSEFTTTNIPQLYIDTFNSEETPKVPKPNSDHYNNEIQSITVSDEDVQNIIKPAYKNIDFQLGTESNAEITDFSKLTTVITSSENLDHETDQNLQSSSVLEIFKESKGDNFENSCKENLYSKKENEENLEYHADEEHINESTSKINGIERHNSIEDAFYSLQAETMENNKNNYQAEASTNIFDKQEINNKFAMLEKHVSGKFEDPFNEVNGTKKLDKSKADAIQNYYNNTLRTLVDASIKIEDTEEVEAPVNIANVLKEEKDNFSKDETNEFATKIKHFNKQNSSLTNIAESQPPLSLDATDFVTQNYDNNYNDILSVDLHETISTAPNNVKEVNFEENVKSNLGEIIYESENANNTSIDTELDHVVIKKVLDAQEILDDPLATSKYAFMQNSPQINYIDQNEHENDTKNSNSDAMYPYTNHTMIMDRFYNSIETEHITVSTETENISKTNINEYYQTTEAIEHYKNNNFIKTIRKTSENVLVINDSDNNPEQDYTLNSSENIQNEHKQITDNTKIDNPRKQVITLIDANMENIPAVGLADIDKYNQSMETTENFENNTNLIKNILNEHLTVITEIDKENHVQDTNKKITLKHSEITQREYERFGENNMIPDINKYTDVTEKYEKNISTTIENIQTKSSELGKIAKDPRSVNKQVITLPMDDKAATLFEAYPPRDVGQTFNDNLADEFAGIGKALPVSVANGYNRSTIIIILSSGTAILFIVISLTIFLISFQRQHGTLDIEMQERNCGKDDLDDENAQTFAKLLEVELSPSIAVTLEESEECL